MTIVPMAHDGGQGMRIETFARLLTYVSLLERMATVVAGGVVQEKLGPAGVDELCDELTRGLSQGDRTAAICDLIHAAGKRLAVVSPRPASPADEPHPTEQCAAV